MRISGCLIGGRSLFPHVKAIRNGADAQAGEYFPDTVKIQGGICTEEMGVDKKSHKG